MQYSEIAKEIRSLNKKDLKSLKTLVNYLLDSQDESKNLLLFYDTLVEEARNKGIYLTYHSKFKKSSHYASFKEKFDQLEEFTELVAKDFSLRQRKALYRLYAKLLINALQKSKTEVNMIICSMSIDRIPALVSKSFPGYVESGLLPMLLKSKEVGDKK